MKIWVGITDEGWFDYLRIRNPDEVNFWQPSANQGFRALEPGEPFLFKLHSPKNYIVGGGFFVSYSALPCSLAWEAFGMKNGVGDYPEFLALIRKYRAKGRHAGNIEINPTVGCNILAQPFFFPEDRWIPIPSDWASNIVKGKTYSSVKEPGLSLWQAVETNIRALDLQNRDAIREEKIEEAPFYMIRGRLGQGAFRILVTDAYRRRCAITGEKTLPVLEAAHIKPYGQSGPNMVKNGLLLRSDIHKLFDTGYLTITPEFRVEISRCIKEEYENGREYYAHHGSRLVVTPDQKDDMPSPTFLQWHNENVYRA